MTRRKGVLVKEKGIQKENKRKGKSGQFEDCINIFLRHS